MLCGIHRHQHDPQSLATPPEKVIGLPTGLPARACKTTRLVAGLRMAGMVAPMVLDRTINGVWFDAYVAQVLVSELRPGHVAHHAQPLEPQTAGSERAGRSGRLDTALPSTDRARLQSDREGVLLAQRNAPQGV